MRKLASTVLGAAILFTAAAAVAQSAANKRGEYLSRIMDCGGCHTDGALIGKPNLAQGLAGSGIGFGVPGLGVFYPPNLRVFSSWRAN